MPSRAAAALARGRARRARGAWHHRPGPGPPAGRRRSAPSRKEHDEPRRHRPRRGGHRPPGRLLAGDDGQGRARAGGGARQHPAGHPDQRHLPGRGGPRRPARRGPRRTALRLRARTPHLGPPAALPRRPGGVPRGPGGRRHRRQRLRGRR
ncbi:hypothetical protein SGPA1_10549 [Streptomyces misionensis JCM 4497]